MRNTNKEAILAERIVTIKDAFRPFVTWRRIVSSITKPCKPGLPKNVPVDMDNSHSPST